MPLSTIEFLQAFCIAAVLIILAVAAHVSRKKPTRSELIYTCHKEYIALQTQLKINKFIDVDAWREKIRNYQHKWNGYVDADILSTYVDHLYSYISHHNDKAAAVDVK